MNSNFIPKEQINWNGIKAHFDEDGMINSMFKVGYSEVAKELHYLANMLTMMNCHDLIEKLTNLLEQTDMYDPELDEVIECIDNLNKQCYRNYENKDIIPNHMMGNTMWTNLQINNNNMNMNQMSSNKGYRQNNGHGSNYKAIDWNTMFKAKLSGKTGQEEHKRLLKIIFNENYHSLNPSKTSDALSFVVSILCGKTDSFTDRARSMITYYLAQDGRFGDPNQKNDLQLAADFTTYLEVRNREICDGKQVTDEKFAILYGNAVESINLRAKVNQYIMNEINQNQINNQIINNNGQNFNQNQNYGMNQNMNRMSQNNFNNNNLSNNQSQQPFWGRNENPQMGGQ